MQNTAGPSSSSKKAWSDLSAEDRELLAKKTRSLFYQALQNIAPGRRFGPVWDGGRDSSLRNRRPAWSRIAQLLYENDIFESEKLIMKAVHYLVAAMVASDKLWPNIVPRLLDEFLEQETSEPERRGFELVSSLARLAWLQTLPDSQKAIELSQIEHPAVRMAAKEALGLRIGTELLREAENAIQEEGIDYTELRERVRKIVTGDDRDVDH